MCPFLFIKLKNSVARRCSVKKVFLEISQNSQENTSVRVFFNKAADSGAWILRKF